jgi:hypothetical protein
VDLFGTCTENHPDEIYAPTIQADIMLKKPLHSRTGFLITVSLDKTEFSHREKDAAS